MAIFRIDYILRNLEKSQIFYHSIVQAVSFSTHALPDTFLTKHPLILLVLILPTLVRMENQVCSAGIFANASSSMVVTMLSTGRSDTQMFFFHGFYNHSLELRRISFVRYPFWHSLTPHLLDIISYCLTNGVLFIFARDRGFAVMWPV